MSATLLKRRNGGGIAAKRAVGRARRHFRLRTVVRGTEERPRLVVTRSLRHITAQVVDEAVSGTRSEFGARRIGEGLDYARPAHTLILYGTNDWNRASFECRTSLDCDTVDNLRHMVGTLGWLARWLGAPAAG